MIYDSLKDIFLSFYDKIIYIVNFQAINNETSVKESPYINKYSFYATHHAASDKKLHR